MHMHTHGVANATYSNLALFYILQIKIQIMLNYWAVQVLPILWLTVKSMVSLSDMTYIPDSYCVSASKDQGGGVRQVESRTARLSLLG